MAYLAVLLQIPPPMPSDNGGTFDWEGFLLFAGAMFSLIGVGAAFSSAPLGEEFEWWPPRWPPRWRLLFVSALALALFVSLLVVNQVD